MLSNLKNTVACLLLSMQAGFAENKKAEHVEGCTTLLFDKGHILICAIHVHACVHMKATDTSWCSAAAYHPPHCITNVDEVILLPVAGFELLLSERAEKPLPNKLPTAGLNCCILKGTSLCLTSCLLMA